jgi:hypothetical protein
MSLLTSLRDRELTGVNASYQWLALRSLMHQFDQEWFFEHDDMQKLYLILCELCINQKHCQKSFRYNKKNIKMRKYRALFLQRHVFKTT